MAGGGAVTDFSAAVADYLVTRRAMGYKLKEQGRMLGQFAIHLEGMGAEHLTMTHAVDWATQSPGASRVWCSVKLGMVRSFARYLVALDPATEIPPVGLLPEPSHRIVPHIYSDEEIARLIQAAGRLCPEHRADTYQTLIALIAVTGMRVNESVCLDRDDVDLDQGLLTIRNSKFGKSRQLPLHPSTVDAIAAYAARRDERRPKPKSPSFFTSAIGTRVLRDNVCTVFPRLVREAGLTSPNRVRPPRLHDLRHSFAVRCVISWYRDGLDVERRLPLLSTWLGHVAPSSTYWYLSAVPELLELIADRIDAIHEVGR
jgi:integrase/recombinase XerD